MEAEEIIKAYYNSPIGLVEVTGTESYVSSVKFTDRGQARKAPPFVLEKCIRQLDEYFKGKRQEFSIDLKLEGTEFQKKVWAELTTIKFAKTISYIELAKRLKDPLAVRAVGNANAKNHFCLIFPCHRVIGSNGHLIGYAGGLKRKQWLLEHERKVVGNFQMSLF
ncbi:MAG TPA: methylated-DNA--[protein]-cysteine S-methyltransferase [Cytophagales bacterium]|nr:methylated-DNA--[protein]-cysteine S-methyltransferase [Cytophagales bacterium]